MSRAGKDLNGQRDKNEEIRIKLAFAGKGKHNKLLSMEIGQFHVF